MNPKNNVEFYFAVFKNGALIKRSSFSKSYLVTGSFPKTDIVLRNSKGDDLIKGIFYWNKSAEFIFFDHILQQSRTITAEKENDTRRVSFDVVKGLITIQIRSVLTGEPLKIEIPDMFLKSKKANREKKRAKRFFWQLPFLLVGLLLVKPFHIPELKEKAVSQNPSDNRVRKLTVQKTDKSQFLRVLQKNRGDIEQCQFEHSFQNGAVKYRATVNAKGKISKLSVLSDDILSEPLLSCLDQKIKTWTFPASTQSDQILFFAFKLQKDR